MGNDSLIAQAVRDSIYEADKPLYQKTFDFIDDKDNLSGVDFVICFYTIFDGNYEAFKNGIIDDWRKRKYEEFAGIAICFFFFCITIFSFMTIVFTFLKRFKWIRKLAVINLILIVLTLINIVFFDTLFETWRQIKWGYYLFTLVQVGILWLSRKPSELR